MSDAAKILGEALVDVVNFDGTKSRFKMKRLSIRQLIAWCDHVIEGKSFEIVCLCTGQPPEVIDLLSPESFGELVNRALSENFSRATPMIQADPMLAAKMLPALRRVQHMLSLIASANGEASSRVESPTESRAGAASASSTSPSATSPTPSPNVGESSPSASSESSTP